MNVKPLRLLWSAALLCLLCTQPLRAQWPLKNGHAVVTCFSGFVGNNPANGIDNNYVFGVVDVRNTAAATPGLNWAAPMYHDPSWRPSNLGQVFGAEISNRGDIFLSATTTYRNLSYGTNAFGPLGPGGIYKVDGITGAISNFIALPNQGSGLGNMAYDRWNDQLFVTNHHDGLIYRIGNLGGATGVVLSTYNFPGIPIATPARPDFVPLGDRLWGIAVYGNKLYFSVWVEHYGGISAAAAHPTRNNEIWSIDLLGGNFVPSSAQLIYTMPGFYNGSSVQTWAQPVADIAVSSDGQRMLLAERGMRYDDDPGLSSPYIAPHTARVLEISLSGSTWSLNKQVYIGKSQFKANACGGIDYGYSGYNARTDEVTLCDSMIWASGNALTYPSAPNNLVYGLVGIQASGNTTATAGIADYVIDLDGLLNTTETKSDYGDVEIMDNCNDPCARMALEAAMECSKPDTTMQMTFWDVSTLNPGFNITWIEWCVNGVSQGPVNPGDSLVYNFPKADTYEVCLKVFAYMPTGQGSSVICCRDSVCKEFFISPNLCDYRTVDIKCTQDPANPLCYTFTDVSSQGSVTQWTPNLLGMPGFTQITNGPGSSITYCYPGPGVYVVQMLELWHFPDGRCCVDTVQKRIEIGQQQAPCCDSLRNRIQNGQFNTSLLPWTAFSGTPFHQPQDGCKAPGSAELTANVQFGDAIQQSIPILAGLPYDFSFCVKNLAPATVGPVQFLVRAASASASVTYTNCPAAACEVLLLTPVLSSGQWETFCVKNWVPKNNYSRIIIQLVGALPGAIIAGRVDDVCLAQAAAQPLPCPAIHADFSANVTQNPAGGPPLLNLTDVTGWPPGSVLLSSVWTVTALPSGPSQNYTGATQSIQVAAGQYRICLVSMAIVNGITCTADRCDTVSVGPSPGGPSGGLRVSPNPAGDYVVVALADGADMQGWKLYLTDARGSVVLSAIPLGGIDNELDISRLQPGFYMIRAEAGGRTAYGKLVKR